MLDVSALFDQIEGDAPEAVSFARAIISMRSLDWWQTIPCSFNKRGEQHTIDALRLCNECSGEIITAIKAG